MPESKNKRGLGRGFESLIPTELIEAEFDTTAKSSSPTADTIQHIHPDLIDPNPHQPRMIFDEVQLEGLADSIRHHGILQPLVATKQGERYELIAGERRLRAAKIVGEKTVPVIVRSFDEQDKLELALIENLQRAALNPIETATAYRKLIDQFNLTYEQIGQKVGKDNTTIVNTVRLLGLPLEAKRAIAGGKISEGHGRVILAVPDSTKQLALLDLIIKNSWTVRQAEEFARAFKEKGNEEAGHARIAKTNPLTKDLSDYLGTKVTLYPTAKGGRIHIEYYSDEELERIYQAIKKT